MIGKNATFTCNTVGREAHWVLNGIPMTFSYENEKQVYEDRGVTFLEDAYQQYFNLTMIIHTSLALNNTMIFCSVIDADFTVEMSQRFILLYQVSTLQFQKYHSQVIVYSYYCL